MSADRPTVRLDTDALVALAHPLRSRLLSTLRLHGSATATELAERLETNTGATSYHLRRLESVGLVTDTGEGVGRRRVWAPSTWAHSYVPSDFEHAPDAGAALAWLSRHYLQQMGERLGTWLDEQERWPSSWRDACGLSDDKVLVTADQASRLAAELAEVVGRYRRAGEADESAREVLVWTAQAPITAGDPPP
jgi:DNA-binding transcriptional ArsR family regulator